MKMKLMIIALLFAALFVLFTPVQGQTWNTAFAKVTSQDNTEVRYSGTATIIGTGSASSTSFDLIGTDRIFESFLDTEMINDTGAVTVKLQYQKASSDWKDMTTVFTIAEKLDSTFVSAIDTSFYASNDVNYRYLLTGGAANDTIRVKLQTTLKKKGFR
jgi:hypothetical protein